MSVVSFERRREGGPSGFDPEVSTHSDMASVRLHYSSHYDMKGIIPRRPVTPVRWGHQTSFWARLGECCYLLHKLFAACIAVSQPHFSPSKLAHTALYTSSLPESQCPCRDRDRLLRLLSALSLRAWRKDRLRLKTEVVVSMQLLYH